MGLGDRYGLHRVVEPIGVLPQPAWKLDATPICHDNELLLDVERLNIDSASFVQLKQEAAGDSEQVKEKILQIVSERGKMHNPVTGSGGMLLGRVLEKGTHFPGSQLQCGDTIATLVSLTLTPLQLDQIDEVDMNTGQIAVRGKAILFASGPYARLPHDLPERVALAALDVCGAPAQTARWVRAGQTVAVLGAGGKSGLLSLYHAKKQAGLRGRVLALEAHSTACREIAELDLADEVLHVDATDPVAVLQAVHDATAGELADITINCVNVADTELSSILATRTGGAVYFFSTAVRFTAASLGAEGVGKDVHLLIGNGYAQGHAQLALNTLRQHQGLLHLFRRRYGVADGVNPR
ncbi:L-erythro-3,5-diaminohexanoate dehydrogenase [Mechercharimyces sp. CAU 1602]|uniref:L-erythro-3,5-diaminohexanoate dehydrogenase n=1 Tax=Mechercharimyces sp. CAU 1602 TaxID=2973933 RepID=UPI00216194E3|nr:L-erythro-3,5-diaminohexanoate dehydrogenase [Mechercharimyces sp. CAU 1602]MCS1352637.1 L-erythro-3,5-diaminohexanoate dehydrogenase [Mechercharimyces sp. CAU 1602]